MSRAKRETDAIEPNRCVICHAVYRKIRNTKTCCKACSDEHRKARLLRFDAVYHKRYYGKNRERILACKKLIRDENKAHPLTPPPPKAPKRARPPIVELSPEEIRERAAQARDTRTPAQQARTR